MQYRMPSDIREKEKAIGGLITWGQFFYLLIGFVGGLLMFFLFSKLIGMGAIIPGLMVFGASAPFAFMKKEDMPYPVYLRRKKAFDRKNHFLPNIRINRKF